MFRFLRQKQSFRFIATTALLALGAMGAAVVSEIADRMRNDVLGAVSAKLAITLAVLIVLYIVAKLAQNASLHSEYSLQVTNSGLVFSALILLVAILSLSSGNNLLYLFLSILLATMFVSLIGSRLSLSRVDVAVRFPDHMFAREAAPFDITLANRKRVLPAFSMGIAILESVDPAADEPRMTELAYLPVVPARVEAVTRQVRVFEHRGVFPIRGILLGTRFPLGFIEQRRQLDVTGEVVVYPMPASLDRVESLIRQSQGRVESRVKGAGSDLYAIRQYQDSDHHHHIDWKATAKTAVLMVREFTRDDDWRVTVIFDATVDPALAARETFPAQFERGVETAASVLKRLSDEGAELRLLAGGQDTGYGEGQTHLYRMFRVLAEVRPGVGEDVVGVPAEDADAREEDACRIVVTSRPDARAFAGASIIGFDEE